MTISCGQGWRSVMQPRLSTLLPVLGTSQADAGLKVKSESEVAQSCLTLSDPKDCSPSGSSVHGIFQARVLEWGALAFSELALYLSLICHLSSCVCNLPVFPDDAQVC